MKRNLAIISLAALGAMAGLAVMGASFASATVLCEENASPCPSGKTYASGTELKAKSTNATLSTSLGTITCPESQVTSKTTAASGTPLLGETTALTWGAAGSCSRSGTTDSCTVTSVNLNYRNALEATTGGNGTLKVETLKNGAPGAKVVCVNGGFTTVECTFTKSPIELKVTGGFIEGIGKTPLGKVTAENVALNRTGGLCPSTSTWSAEYILKSVTSGVTSFNSVFVE